MKTNGIHISNILHTYRAECLQNPTHEFTFRPERHYFALGSSSLFPVKNFIELAGVLFIVVVVPGELNVLRIHALTKVTDTSAEVFNDDNVYVSEVDRARLYSTIATAIYQMSCNSNLTHVNF